MWIYFLLFTCADLKFSCTEFSSTFLPLILSRYGPPRNTEYRVIVENLSSRVSWQVCDLLSSFLFVATLGHLSKLSCFLYARVSMETRQRAQCTYVSYLHPQHSTISRVVECARNVICRLLLVGIDFVAHCLQNDSILSSHSLVGWLFSVKTNWALST